MTYKNNFNLSNLIKNKSSSNYQGLDYSFQKIDKPVHYFNHIPYTRSPYYLGWSISAFFVYMLVGINYYFSFYLFWGLMGLAILFSAFFWMSEMYNEAVFRGKYTEKVYACLIMGFFLFLFTECLVFAGFFWALFDRYFNMSSSTYSNLSHFIMASENIGIILPTQGLFCLYFSGVYCNQAHYCYYYNSDIGGAVVNLYFSVALGMMFLYIQYQEFNHLLFKINYHVIHSAFYLLAGFHGMHVTMGLIFLFTQFQRFIEYHFTRSRHLGFCFAISYWHFVDIVWFFLFWAFYIHIYHQTQYSVEISNPNILVKDSMFRLIQEFRNEQFPSQSVDFEEMERFVEKSKFKGCR